MQWLWESVYAWNTAQDPTESSHWREALRMWSVQEITHLALLNIWTYEIEHMKSHTPKNSYECKERGKTFKYRSSLNTPESIQARNCTKADNVAKPLQTCQCWACIREFTQARNLTNALNMTKPSSGAHIFFNVTHIEQQNKGSTCGKSFNQKTYLVIHQIRSVRSVDEESQLLDYEFETILFSSTDSTQLC